MLRSIKNLFEDKLGALDGEIGHVNDFYFDDETWAVRYLVANTGSWMPGRLVLISPHAFGNLYQGGKILLVNLTRQQIERGPSIESPTPVSREFEEDYHRHFGWPFYWQGGEMWGMSGFPVVPGPRRLPKKHLTAKGGDRESDEPHLRSAKAIIGLHIQATDETAGHVADFVMDDENWAIQYMVVDAGHWLSGKRVMISPSLIDRIGWKESKVYVNLTKKDILGSPIFDPAAFGIREHDPRLFL